LETLEAVARFGFLADNIEDRVNKLSTFSVVSLGPVITSTRLTKHKVVLWGKSVNVRNARQKKEKVTKCENPEEGQNTYRAEKLTEWSSTDRVHSSWFQVNQDSTGNVLSTGSFVVVDVDTLKLEVGVSVVGTSGVDTVFVRDDFPEFGTNLSKSKLVLYRRRE
jgi:uncharacterized Zn ribbon protein